MSLGATLPDADPAVAVPASPGAPTAGRSRPPRAALVAACCLIALSLGATMFWLLAAHRWPGGLVGLASEAVALEARLGRASLAAAFAVQLLIALCGVLPASAGALAAGMLYGSADGFLLSATALLAGAVLAFALSRSLFRPLVARIVLRHPRARALDRAIESEGWRLVCLMRISPVMPFAVTSYALGLTALRFGPYLTGSLASLPALAGYVVLGSLARRALSEVGTNAAPHARLLHLGLLALGVAGTALLLFASVRIARRALAPGAPNPTPRVAGADAPSGSPPG